MNTEDMESIKNQIIEGVLFFLPRLLGAVILLIVGFWLINKISKLLIKGMEKRQLDASLKAFLGSLTSIGLKVMLLIAVVGILGVKTSSFVAILASAGLAIGLALQGSLQNFAGGVMLLIFRPFKVGDVITGAGYTALVHEIQIFNTILKTFDNKTIIVPNAQLSNTAITNFSMEEKRRVDMTFGIGYGDDIDNAKQTIDELIKADSRILQEPAEPFMAVSELADSSVNIVVRVWTFASDYWGVFFDMQEKVYKAFGDKNISIPFPQMDVHVHQN